MLGDLETERLSIADHAAPGCHRQTEAGDWLDGRDGRNIEKGAAAPLRNHMRDHGTRHTHDVHQVLLDSLCPGRVVEAHELPERRRTVVIDQNIDTAEARNRCLHDADAVAGTPTVCRNPNDLRTRFRTKLLGGL